MSRAISWDLPLELEFAECDSCRAKPGSPTLCHGCLRNRAVIEAMAPLLKPKRKAKAQAHAAQILWPRR